MTSLSAVHCTVIVYHRWRTLCTARERGSFPRGYCQVIQAPYPGVSELGVGGSERNVHHWDCIASSSLNGLCVGRDLVAAVHVNKL